MPGEKEHKATQGSTTVGSQGRGREGNREQTSLLWFPLELEGDAGQTGLGLANFNNFG